MKKFLFLMTLVLIGFSSCGKDSEEQATLGDSLSSPTESIEVNAQESGLEIVINSSADWTADSDVDWCKIGESTGKAGTSKLALSFSKNTTGVQRKGYLQLKTVSHSVTLTIPLTQTKD